MATPRRQVERAARRQAEQPAPGVEDGSGAEAPTRLRAFVDLFPRRAVDTLCQRDYSGFIADAVYEQLQAGCAAQVATP